MPVFMLGKTVGLIAQAYGQKSSVIHSTDTRLHCKVTLVRCEAESKAKSRHLPKSDHIVVSKQRNNTI